MKKLDIPSKEELSCLYNTTHKTISSLSRHYNTSNPTVRKWLIHHGIPRRSQKEAMRELNVSQIPEKNILLRHYDSKSIKEMKKEFGVGQATVYSWLEHYGIDKRTLSDSCSIVAKKRFEHLQFDKATVEKVYDDSENILDAANRLNVSYSHMRQLLKRYDIEVKIPWRSNIEIELAHHVGNCITNDKSLINPFELDIVIPERKLAIEYCGLYWHSETFGMKRKSYHREKTDLCNEKGYDLITVFESDDLNKVKALIDRKIGRTRRIHARKCVVREISTSESGKFNKLHHLSGNAPASFAFGLFYENELVMCITFGKARYSNEEYECIRMTSHSNYAIVGGASKLFTHFIRNHDPKSIVTYADRRFGNGGVYKHCGFRFEGNTGSNFFYFQKNTLQLKSRVVFQKHKLSEKLTVFDSDLTEYENMVANGYGRIWDCGNAKYVWNAI